MLCLSALFLSCAKEQSTKLETALTPLAGESCLKTSITTSGCALQSPITFNVTNLPGYPGCSFSVTVEVCLEIDVNGNTYLTVGDYTMGNHTCQALVDSLSALFLTPTEIDDNEFISRFDKLMFTRLEDYLFAHFGGNIQCGSFRNVTITFIRQACTAICFYEYTIIKEGDGGSRVPMPTNFVRTTCSTEGCCRRETRLCFNPTTNMLDKTTSTTTYPGNVTAQNACSGGEMIPPVIPRGTQLTHCNSCAFSCTN
jgi:Fe-S cluster assembly iron-binding protein IscA